MALLLWFFLALGSIQASFSHRKPNGSAWDSYQPMQPILSNESDSVNTENHYNGHKNIQTDCYPNITSSAESTTAQNLLLTGVHETENNGSSPTLNASKSSNAKNILTYTDEFHDNSKSTSEVTSLNTGNERNPGTKNISRDGTVSTSAQGTTTDNKKVSSNLSNENCSSTEQLSTSTVESTATPEGTSEITVPNVGSEGNASAKHISTNRTEPTTVSVTMSDSNSFKKNTSRKPPIARPPTPVPLDYDGDYGGEYYDISKVTFRKRNTTDTPQVPRIFRA